MSLQMNVLFIHLVQESITFSCYRLNFSSSSSCFSLHLFVQPVYPKQGSKKSLRCPYASFGFLYLLGSIGFLRNQHGSLSLLRIPQDFLSSFSVPQGFFWLRKFLRTCQGSLGFLKFHWRSLELLRTLLRQSSPCGFSRFLWAPQGFKRFISSPNSSSNYP